MRKRKRFEDLLKKVALLKTELKYMVNHEKSAYILGEYKKTVSGKLPGCYDELLWHIEKRLASEDTEKNEDNPLN